MWQVGQHVQQAGVVWCWLDVGVWVSDCPSVGDGWWHRTTRREAARHPSLSCPARSHACSSWSSWSLGVVACESQTLVTEVRFGVRCPVGLRVCYHGMWMMAVGRRGAGRVFEWSECHWAVIRTCRKSAYLGLTRSGRPSSASYPIYRLIRIEPIVTGQPGSAP